MTRQIVGGAGARSRNVAAVWTAAFGIEAPGADRYAGSPATVLFGCDDVPEAQIRALTARFGGETTVVYGVGNDASQIGLRFWVPGGELSLCIHGVLGAVVALVEAGRLRGGSDRLHTRAGDLRVEWTRAGTGLEVHVDQPAPILGPPIEDPRAVLEALELDGNALDPDVGPVQVVSTSRPKIFLPVRDVALRRARPVGARVTDVCAQHAATGIYAFCRRHQAPMRDVTARQFPADAGFSEDPATGVAATAMASYLVAHEVLAKSPRVKRGQFHYRIVQGEAMKCPCRLDGTVDVCDSRIERTAVAGRAVVLW